MPKVVNVCAGGVVNLIGGVNQSGLVFAWSDLNTTATGHPIFANGKIYVPTPYGHTVAINAENGKNGHEEKVNGH